MSNTDAETLAGLIQTSSTLFVTGAGISVASGISPFRGSDPDAVWNKDVLEKATLNYFHRHPVESWNWYLGRFNSISGALPNAAHVAIRDIEKKFPSTKVLTQNIDGLHQAAGSQNLIHIHGNWLTVRCTGKYCANGSKSGTISGFVYPEKFETCPKCDKCGKNLRPHVLWFDESYDGHKEYRYNDALNWMNDAEVIIFVGTSFSVGITNLALNVGERNGALMVVIDPNMTQPPLSDMILISEAAEVFLPKLEAELQ
jgi:NAD-dependent SIR2 family protein deacetylase